MTILFDSIVETDYGQFDLVWGDGEGFDGDWDRVFDGHVNGLAGSASGDGLYVNLGRRSGGSQVRMVLVDAQPTVGDDWEDIVEVSIVVPDGPVQWAAWAWDDSGDLALPAGTYRVRVNARGRDAGAEDEFAEEVVDFYLLEIWAAPADPDAIVRTTSKNAEYWHRENGGRR
ncbi:hypothetical protein [Nocardioides oleivorans]|uniref:hypothetical protein n=1 Tax=Nocardioides oleivorans TaxID=273676 RepID=UPI001010280E|nr:hypothetical protein [Nocardioides oleivorans]